MKKIIAMLIACLMVVALVPVIAVPAAAAEKVVFVGKDGTGDGSAADKPMGNLIDAFAAIGDEDGTIVLVNMYESTTEHRIAAHAGHITVTSKYNGVDYKGGIYASGTAHLILGGDTTFENINLNLKSTWVWRLLFNHLTMGEGVNVTSDAGTFPKLYLVGADQDGASAADPSKDTHITLKSGKYLEVIGGARSAFPSDITGKVILEVTGDVEIQKLMFGCRTTKELVNLNSALVVLDGGKITNWVGTGDMKSTGCLGDVQIVLTKNFKIEDSFNLDRISADAEPVFNGISGASAFFNLVPSTLLSKTYLLVDPSIKAAVDATDKVNKDSFTEIKEYTYVGTIGSGTLDAATAPEVTEPVTTPVTEAPTTEAPVVSGEDYVVIDHKLLTEDCLELFTGFGCKPILKEIDGKVVGLGMGDVNSGMGYPYLLFGDKTWKDYTIEFTAHDMNRVAGFVRSQNPLPQIDGHDGLAVGLEGLSNPGRFFSFYSVVNVEQNKSVFQNNTSGEVLDAKFNTGLVDLVGEIRFVITVIGEDVTASMTCEDADGQVVTQNIKVKCDTWDKTQGAAGLRAVWRQLEGTQSNGYFTDLKVTLHGDTAKEWKAAHPETTEPTVDTTVAPTNPEVTPPTGDASVVIFAISAACLVAAAAMVFLKKRIAE